MKNELLKYLITSKRYDYSLTVDFGSLAVQAKVSDRDVCKDLEDYFYGFISERSDPDIIVHILEDPAFSPAAEPDMQYIRPGKERIREYYRDEGSCRIVKKVSTGMYFLFDDSRNLAAGPCRSNTNQLVNFINNRFVEHEIKKGSLLIHAAATTRKLNPGEKLSYPGEKLITRTQNSSQKPVTHGLDVGQNPATRKHDPGQRTCARSLGLALAGPSGSGKSTMALHLMNEGWDFVSNDRLLIRRNNTGIEMKGGIKHPRVNPGTLLHNPFLRNRLTPSEQKELERLPKNELWQLEEKRDLMIHDLFGEDRFCPVAELTHLIILNWTLSDELFELNRVDLNQRPDLFSGFIKDPGLFYSPDIRGESTNRTKNAGYAEQLDSCRVYEARGGVDFDALTRLLNRLSA